MVWVKSCTNGLEDCNPHSVGTSYSAGRAVPPPSVLSIHDALFGSDADHEGVAAAEEKLAGSTLGTNGGESIWDRIKNAFDGGGRSPTGDATLLASAVSPHPSRDASPRAAVGTGEVLNRFPTDSRVPGRVGPVEAEKGLSKRDLVWGVSGAVGLTFLLVWAFRKREGEDL